MRRSRRWHEILLGERSPAPRVNRVLDRRPWLVPGLILCSGFFIAAAGLVWARSAQGFAGMTVGLVVMSVGTVGLLFGIAGMLSALVVGLLGIRDGEEEDTEEEWDDEDSHNG